MADGHVLHGSEAGSSELASEPFNESELLGRVMAHAYADEIEKRASVMSRARDLVQRGANKAWATSGNNGRTLGRDDSGLVAPGDLSEGLKSLGVQAPSTFVEE